MWHASWSVSLLSAGCPALITVADGAGWQKVTKFTRGSLSLLVLSRARSSAASYSTTTLTAAKSLYRSMLGRVGISPGTQMALLFRVNVGQYEPSGRVRSISPPELVCVHVGLEACTKKSPVL